MKEKIIFKAINCSGGIRFHSNSEAMKIKNNGDHPIEGYLLEHGVVERKDGQKLDFFTIKFYFKQVGD